MSIGTEAATKRPGLRMVQQALDDLPSLAAALAALPAGYGFRTYRPGDEAAWAAIMNTGQMEVWDEISTMEKLTGRPHPQFDPDGLFFVTFGPDEQPVGSACAWLADPAERERGVLHMVCVLPEHRGRGLAYPLCLAVLHRFRQRDLRRVYLNTGDWRLGAVKTYLKLGFQPVFRHPLHPQQWREVLQLVGWTAPVEPEIEQPQ